MYCRYAEQYANDVADLLAPQSGAYYDVWLDGEKFFAHTMEVRCCWVAAVADLSRGFLLFSGGDNEQLLALSCVPRHPSAAAAAANRSFKLSPPPLSRCLRAEPQGDRRPRLQRVWHQL